MKKYLLASSAILCLASPLKADFTHSPYIGLGAGGANAQHSIFYGEDLGTPATRKEHDANARRHTFAGNILLGWGIRFAECWHLSAEVDYLLTGLETDNRVAFNAFGNTYLTSRVKNKGGFGAAIRFGYHLTNDTLIYVRAGFENRKFDVNFTKKIAPNGPEYHRDFGFRKTSFVPGAGVEIQFAKNWMLGAEFRTAAFGDSGTFENTQGGQRESINVKPRVSTYLVTIKYKLKDLF